MEPCEQIEWVEAEELNPNDWNPNRVLTAEFDLLINNILSLGWVQPILINANKIIIDGFHRWRISMDVKEVKDRYKGKVPCVVLDVDDREAMCITIRMNRAKGVHESKSMANIVKKLIDEYGMSQENLMKDLGMSAKEVNLLLSDTVLTARNIKDWKYSRAWYPIEDGKKYGKGT